MNENQRFRRDLTFNNQLQSFISLFNEKNSSYGGTRLVISAFPPHPSSGKGIYILLMTYRGVEWSSGQLWLLWTFRSFSLWFKHQVYRSTERCTCAPPISVFCLFFRNSRESQGPFYGQSLRFKGKLFPLWGLRSKKEKKSKLARIYKTLQLLHLSLLSSFLDG